MKYYISAPPMNLVSRLVTAVMAVLAVVGAFFFGLAILIILAAVFSLFVLVFYLRAWWLRRTIRDAREAKTGTAPDGKVIDAEYTVVSRQRN